MTDMRFVIDVASAVHRGMRLYPPSKPPIALDDGIGCIDTVDDDGNAGTSGNHNHRTAVEPSTRSRIKKASTSPIRITGLWQTLIEPTPARVKAATETSGKPNVSGCAEVQMRTILPSNR